MIKVFQYTFNDWHNYILIIATFFLVVMTLKTAIKSCIKFYFTTKNAGEIAKYRIINAPIKNEN
jgi:hypothetical protein